MSKQRIEKNVQIITIDKTEAFKYKTTFFAGKDAKTGHKNASNTADKHPHTPQRPRADPGLHLSHTRASVVGTPGSQAALQAVFDKRKACLDEKRSRFNRFRICSRTVPVFIV